MNDFTILSIDAHLAASKNTEYRKSTFSYYRALVGFLQSNSLTTRDLMAEEVSEGFKLRRFDLTDEGFELIRASLDKWLKAVSSGKVAPTDISMLEKSLAKIRGKNS